MTMDVVTNLDPEIAALLGDLPIAAFDLGALAPELLPGIREAMRGMATPDVPPTTAVSRELIVPDPAGRFDSSVRVTAPPDAREDRPCIYWIHGGGYILGTGLGPDARINQWVEDLDCVVVSIEYRLAPEHPYPAPLDDCYAGLAWTAAHADELGIDPSRIAIAGASAGAGLAAGLGLLARDRGEISPSFQLLIYPMIDDRMTTASSNIVGAPIWSRDANVLGWSCYLGCEPGADDVPAYAAAARAGDLAGLPPTWIGVGSLDVFRDEDIDYAMRLLAAGVPTELHVYPGAPHGFDTLMPSTGVARRCRRDMEDALRRALIA
jgi:acetyl esterase/lipase